MAKWMVPAYRRPKELKRLAESWERYCPREPLSVRLTKDEPKWREYEQEDWPRNWNFYVSDAQSAGEAIQEFAERNVGEAIGWLSDDLVIRSEGATQRLSDAAGEWFVAWPNDGFQRWHLPTHFCLGASLIRALGGVVVPQEFPHHFMDNRFKTIADNCGLARYLPDVFVEHMTPFAQKAPRDETFERVVGEFDAAMWRWEEYRLKLVEEIQAVQAALMKEFP